MTKITPEELWRWNAARRERAELIAVLRDIRQQASIPGRGRVAAIRALAEFALAKVGAS